MKTIQVGWKSRWRKKIGADRLFLYTVFSPPGMEQPKAIPTALLAQVNKVLQVLKVGLGKNVFCIIWCFPQQMVFLFFHQCFFPKFVRSKTHILKYFFFPSTQLCLEALHCLLSVHQFFNFGTKVDLNWILVWIELNFGVVRLNIGPIRFEHWSKRLFFGKWQSFGCFEHAWKLAPSKANTLQNSSGFFYAIFRPGPHWTTSPVEMNFEPWNWISNHIRLNFWTLPTMVAQRELLTFSPHVLPKLQCIFGVLDDEDNPPPTTWRCVLILCLSRHLFTLFFCLHSYICKKVLVFSTFCWFVCFPS